MTRRRAWAALLLIAVLATTVLPVSMVGAQTPDTASDDGQTTESTAQPDPAPPADEAESPSGEAEGADDYQDQPDAAELESEDEVAPDRTEPDAAAPPEQAPPPAEEAPSEARAPPAEAEEPAVAPLSAGTPNTWVYTDNTWYAYVGPGENLDVRFAKAAIASGGSDVAIRVRGPGGVDRTCTVTAAQPVGASCAFTDLSAATPGVWQIDFSAAAGSTDRYTWAIDVQSGTTSIDGRAYSERYEIIQNSTTPPVDLSLWYQSEQGFLYQATYTRYNGIGSIFTSDAVGVAELDTCVAAYESMDFTGPNSDTGRLWVPAEAAPGQCGDPYKIFFENPDPSLPETAERWDGSTVWLRPPVALPELANLAFAPDGPTTRSGEFTFDVANFTGQIEVQVDVNNDGDYGDPVDRRVPAAVTQDGTITVPFDGLDGQGNPIPATQDLTARVAITQAGEIHFVNQDVETRAGLEVQALNGPEAGSTTLYWDDTDLVAAGRACTTPRVDGTAGVDSTGGVHGWVCNPATSSPNNGIGGAWGDTRNIDDWTYHTIDESVEIAIPGEPQPPWECASDAWLFQYPTDSGPTAVRAVDMVTGEARDVHTIDGRAINAVAYNPVDDYIYGWDYVNDEFVRIGSDGSVEGLGLPTSWPASILDLNTAEFDADGTLWVAQGGSSTTDLLWARVDMDPDSPTYFQVLDSGSTPTPGDQNLNDWAFSVTDGQLYSVITAATGMSRLLVRFDTATETLVVEQNLGPFVAPNGVSAGPNFGAVYADADGFIYAQDNQTGQIWRVDPATQEASFFAYGPASPLNDGARCFLAPLPVDFGDAPDSYGTTLADDGARHAIPGHDAESNTAPLMLGELVDIETDGQPTDAADGDDGADADDEDGVADPIELAAGEPTTVSVTATNETDQPATLAGWIDLNGNGTFDAGERATVAVPANSGTASYELTFPASTSFGDTHARFRLFPGGVADPQPTGAASAGEAEDHPVTGVVQPPFECPSNAPGLLFQHVAPNLPPTSGTAIDMVTGAPSPLFPNIADRGINAVGYNVLDDYVYGWDQTSNQIVRVGADGSVVELGTPSGFTTGAPIVGDVDDNGQYWIAAPGNGNWWQVDLAPGSPTYNQVIDSGTVSPWPTGADWAFVPGTDALYSVGNVDGADHLFAFDRTTQTFEDLGDLGTGDAINSGSVYAAPGELYTSNNADGVIHRIDIAAVSGERFTNGPASSGNDGARCPVPVLLDFGDAPEGYATLLEDDGPRHGIPSYTEDAGTAPLMLGEAIDPETDGEPTAGADGDDSEGADDGDGVADPIVMVPGQPTTVSVTATNDTGQPATLAGWIDLNGNGTFEAGERVTVSVPANSGTASYELEFPAGTATDATYARFRLFPGAVANPQPTGPASAGEVEDHPVALSAIEVAKTADPESGEAVQPGDTVTYTLTISNVGTTDRTGEVVTDDLTGVLDDAELASGPDVDPSDAGTAEITDGILTFEGDVPAGETVTVTYSVTVLDPADTEGDGTLANAVVGGPCPDPPVTDPQDPAFNPDCVTTHPVRAYDVVKSSDPEDGATAAPDDTVTYTLTVTNTGTAAYTADDPATVSDDLSDVLDDATYNDDATATAGDVAVDGETLTWSGPLAVGESVTVTYSVTVLDPTATDGDAVLENAVVGGPCPDPPITDPDDPDYDPDCHNVVPVRAVVYEKVISDPDVDELQPGDTFTYTVTATNTGGVLLSGLSFTDDLSGVLDDATYNDDAEADVGTVSYSEPVIMWTGALDVGEVATITYSVTIDDPVGGDTVLRNGIVSTDGNCPEGSTDPRCRTVVPQPRVETVKSVVEPDDPQPGDTVTYQIVATNEGDGAALDYPITDDLTDVLDDATYNDDATVDPAGGTLTYTEPELSWVGDIPAGETITITYSVTVNPVDELGDGNLVNAVTSPDCPEPPVTDPDDPDFDPDCVTITPVPGYTTEKTSDAGEAVAPGDVVTYTVTLTNTGGVDLEPTITDDLSGVLDDAAWNDDATASAGDPPTFDGTALTWSGPLGVGETVTLTYSVTVNDRDELGDTVLDNVVVGDGPTNCAEPPVTDPDAPGYDPRCLTEEPVRAYTVAKTADPADGTARPAETVTYTVTVTNLGAVAYTEDDPASFTDDLSGVLDDATYNGDATASAGDVSVEGETLTWSGPLPVDGTVTVTYSVTVDSPVDGDHRLENVVTTPEQECEEGDERCRTDTPVPDLDAEKVADTTDTRPGSTVTYTITLTNTGEGDYTEDDPASFTDDLTDVLDDAAYNDDAAVDPDAGELSYREPVLSWSGPLAAGDSVTLTYTVTVSDPPGGDSVLDNRVTTPEGTCVEGSDDPDCRTSVPVEPPPRPTPPPGPTPPAPPGRPASPVPPPARPSPITPGPVPVTG